MRGGWQFSGRHRMPAMARAEFGIGSEGLFECHARPFNLNIRSSGTEDEYLMGHR
jgi:hypothetical protein